MIFATSSSTSPLESRNFQIVSVLDKGRPHHCNLYRSPPFVTHPVVLNLVYYFDIQLVITHSFAADMLQLATGLELLSRSKAVRAPKLRKDTHQTGHPLPCVP
jgi:hypothetical protein